MNATTSISAAHSIFQRERKGGFAALNEIFRAGSAPNPPLDGDYIGQLVALDELVQVDTSLYLGKAHLNWWWGKWQLVAYFSLSKN